jgi:hypothetical protein
MDVALLGPVAVAFPSSSSRGVQLGFHVVGVGDLAEGPAEQLALRVSGELAESPVDPLEAAGG